MCNQRNPCVGARISLLRGSICSTNRHVGNMAFETPRSKTRRVIDAGILDGSSCNWRRHRLQYLICRHQTHASIQVAPIATSSDRRRIRILSMLHMQLGSRISYRARDSSSDWFIVRALYIVRQQHLGTSETHRPDHPVWPVKTTMRVSLPRPHRIPA